MSRALSYQMSRVAPTETMPTVNVGPSCLPDTVSHEARGGHGRTHVVGVMIGGLRRGSTCRYKVNADAQQGDRKLHHRGSGQGKGDPSQLALETSRKHRGQESGSGPDGCDRCANRLRFNDVILGAQGVGHGSHPS